MTQEVLKLAEDYAKNRANYHIESLYGRSESYTATIKKAMLKAHQALKEALAQEQEPVATDWNAVHEKLELVWYRELSADEGLDEIQDLINTTPPQRKPMTDEEIDFHLDKILRAAGTALKHYSMQKTKDDMRQALREALV